MTTREALCSCGQLRVTTDGEPIRIAICHCMACQRRTGSVFGAQARLPVSRVRVSGRSTVYQRISERGGRLAYRFCPACGATLYYTLEQQPEWISVPIGAFADPGLPAPRISVYESRCHAWVVVPEDIEHSAR